MHFGRQNKVFLLGPGGKESKALFRPLTCSPRSLAQDKVGHTYIQRRTPVYSTKEPDHARLKDVSIEIFVCQAMQKEYCSHFNILTHLFSLFSNIALCPITLHLRKYYYT